MRISFHSDKLKLWSAVCILSAIPSFYWANIETKSNNIAMLLGVLLFILLYTVITSSNFYKKLEYKTYLYKSLKIAFKIRVLYSFLCMASIFMARNNLFISDTGEAHFVNIADGYAGLLSVFLTQLLLGKNLIVYKTMEQNSFFVAFIPSFITTIIQGVMLSLIVFLLALLIWCFFRLKKLLSS